MLNFEETDFEEEEYEEAKVVYCRPINPWFPNDPDYERELLTDSWLKRR